MKGVAFLGHGKCEARDFPDPQPKTGQVVVRMKASGICGSDLWRYKWTPSRLKYSVIPGHQPCGVVEAIGHGVRNVNVGERVSVYHLLACGHCKYCLSGDLMFCSDIYMTGEENDKTSVFWSRRKDGTYHIKKTQRFGVI
jgi:threonine dehydrogenase-like Zn-dependent dehydrogenase